MKDFNYGVFPNPVLVDIPNCTKKLDISGFLNQVMSTTSTRHSEDFERALTYVKDKAAEITAELPLFIDIEEMSEKKFKDSYFELNNLSRAIGGMEMV